MHLNYNSLEMLASCKVTKRQFIQFSIEKSRSDRLETEAQATLEMCLATANTVVIVGEFCDAQISTGKFLYKDIRTYGQTEKLLQTL